MASAPPSVVEFDEVLKPAATPGAKAVPGEAVPKQSRRCRVAAFVLVGAILLLSAICVALYLSVWKCDKPSLHAVPDSEVPSTVKIQPKDTAIFDEIVAETHGKDVVHGAPDTQPVTEATDFTPTPTKVVVLPTGAAAATSGSGAADAVSGKPLKPNATISVVPTAAPAKGGAETGWASIVANATVGSLLIGATGVWRPDQRNMNGAAVLLLKQCGCGSFIGVVVNQHCPRMKMGHNFWPEQRAAWPAFVNNTVHFGGPVMQSWITLHTGAPLAGYALPGLPGVVALQDGLDEAQAQVDAGKSTAAETMFFAGYIAWPAGRLQAEADAGKWTVVEAPATKLLSLAREASWGGYVDKVLAAAAAPAA